MKMQGIEIAVGLTAAPRKTDTLTRTVESLSETGFRKILVSAEPGTDISKLPNHIHTYSRTEKLGPWRNWVQTLADTMRLNPKADAILMCQDDVVFCKSVYSTIDMNGWPSPRCGILAICSSSTYARLDEGYAQVLDRAGWAGAVALLIPRHVCYQILADADVFGWAGPITNATPCEIKGIDPWLGQVMQRLGYEMWICNPSLGCHIGDESTLGHGKNDGNRKSLNFPGEEANGVNVIGYRPGYYLPTGDPVNIVKPVSVLIPVAGPSADLMRSCLNALENTVCPLSVWIYDNGSTDSDVWMNEAYRDHANMIKSVSVRTDNQGYTVANNFMLRQLDEQDGHVLLLNSDCTVTENCIPLLVNSLHFNEDCYAVGPLTFDCGFQSLQQPTRRLQSSIPDKRLKALADNDLPLEPSYYFCRNNFVKEPMVAFFCTLIRKQAIQKIGYLHAIPEFESGLGADDEWCHRCRKQGYEVGVHTGAFAHHAHSETFRRLKINRPQLAQKAIKKYREICK